MTRQAFLAALRQHLKGLDPKAVNEIVADYEAHFADGAGAGRSEADVAAALGDPVRLARELRAEAGLRRWEEKRNPAAAAGAILAVLGLATIDILILAPLLVAVGAVLVALFVACLGVFVAGVVVIGAGLTGFTSQFIGNPAAVPLIGLGLMCGAAATGALLIPVVVLLVNLLVRYGRVHFRLLQPALQPQDMQGDQ